MLNTLTVEMAETVRSMMVATIAYCWRSKARRGKARPLVDALDEHEGGNSGERVSAHERAKAKRRQVRQVVTYLMSIPAVSKVAIRTPSVSRR